MSLLVLFSGVASINSGIARLRRSIAAGLNFPVNHYHKTNFTIKITLNSKVKFEKDNLENLIFIDDDLWLLEQ